MMVNATLSAMLAVAALSGPLQPATSSGDGTLAHIPLCQVLLINDLSAPALVTGPLVNIAVKENDRVVAGQLLAAIDDEQAQLQKLAAEMERDAALARALDDIEVRFARASSDVAATGSRGSTSAWLACRSIATSDSDEGSTSPP